MSWTSVCGDLLSRPGTHRLLNIANKIREKAILLPFLSIFCMHSTEVIGDDGANHSSEYFYTYTCPCGGECARSRFYIVRSGFSF